MEFKFTIVSFQVSIYSFDVTLHLPAIYRILVCEPELTCLSFVPHSSHLVIAGTADGTLQMWDLRESETKHKELVFKDKSGQAKLYSRIPSYTTDWMVNQNHYAPVVSTK
jgi:WD40 repeat protein